MLQNYRHWKCLLQRSFIVGRCRSPYLKQNSKSRDSEWQGKVTGSKGDFCPLLPSIAFKCPNCPCVILFLLP